MLPEHYHLKKSCRHREKGFKRCVEMDRRLMRESDFTCFIDSGVSVIGSSVYPHSNAKAWEINLVKFTSLT